MHEIRIVQKVMPENVDAKTNICIAVDVLRAFTTTRLLFNKGVEVVRICASISEAMALKPRFKDSIIIGEKDGFKMAEADFGNSPSVIPKIPSSIKTVVLKTSNGTPALFNAPRSTEVFAAGLRDIASLSKYIKSKNYTKAPHITVLASSPGEEDLLFAKVLSMKLNDQEIKDNYVFEAVSSADAAKKFIDDDNENFPYEDLVLSATVNDNNDYIQKCEQDEFGLLLRRVNV